MVASRRRVGITIQPADKWNVFDPRLIRWRLEAGDRAAQLVSLSELRRGFEPAAAALAARRADPHQCRIMAAAVSDMVVHGRSGDLEAYLLADKVFHRTLLEASGNEMFRALNDVVAEVLTGRTHHGMMPAQPEPRGHRTARRGRPRDPDARRGRRRDAPCARSSTRRQRLWPTSSRCSPIKRVGGLDGDRIRRGLIREVHHQAVDLGDLDDVRRGRHRRHRQSQRALPPTTLPRSPTRS